MVKAKVETVFTADDLVSGKVEKMSRTVGKFGDKSKFSLKGLNKSIDGFGKKLFGVGKVATVAAVGAGAAFWKLTESSREFDKGISNTAAAMGKTKGEIVELRNLALELGKTTKFTATEAADGLTMLAKAGFDTEKQMKALPAVLAGAAAGDIEMSRAAEIATSNLNAFGLEADQTQMIMDTLATISTKTKTDFDSLQGSLQGAAPTAKALGFSFKQTAVMASLLQDAGIDASEAGSSIKTMLNKLAAPTKKARAMMKEAGVTFTDEFGNMLPPKELFKQLEAMGASFEGNADKVAAFSEAVGLRGQKAALLLAESLSGKGKFDDLTKATEDVTGAAKKMADTKLDNLAGDVTLMGSAWDGLKQSLGGTTDAPVRKLVQQFTAFLGNEDVKKLLFDFSAGVSNFFSWLAMPENQAAIGYWIGKIADFSKVILTAVGIIKVMTAVQAAWNLVVMANPYVLAAAAIIALGALIYAFWPEISAFISKWWGKIRDTATAVWGAIVSGFKVYWEDIKLAVTNPLQFMIDKIRDFLALVAKIPGAGKIANWALGKMDDMGADRSDVQGFSGTMVGAADALTRTEIGGEIKVTAGPGTTASASTPSGQNLSLATSGGW